MELGENRRRVVQVGEDYTALPIARKNATTANRP